MSLPLNPLGDSAVARDGLARITRRTLLGTVGHGMGAAALSSMLAEDFLGRGAFAASAAPVGKAAPNTALAGEGGLPGLPHFAAKAKRVVFLFMSGAPSQVDLLDPKPELEKLRGQQLPDSVRLGQRLTTMTSGQKSLAILPAIRPYKAYGKSGTMMSTMLPHTGAIADELCVVRSMFTESINHAPGVTFCLTGAEQPGRPCAGAWLSYGLGTLNRNLPTFCVMTSTDKEGSCGQLFYDHYWGSGFLPSNYQGVKLRGGGDPVLYLSNPPGLSDGLRHSLNGDLAELNRINHAATGDPEIQARIAQYEMACRMQSSVPELVDMSKEPASLLAAYGPDVQRRGSYAYNCLLARRLLERGVRYVQLMHSGWDQHQNLPTQLQNQCLDTDQPSAALVMDLKQRGLLDDTLVIWGGEFGRTVFCQGDPSAAKHGRDHHPRCFSYWMAGAGVKAGTVYGETDAFSYNVARDGVHVHDFQATLMHMMGIDHERLTFRFQGRDYRLTDVHGGVVRGILA